VHGRVVLVNAPRVAQDALLSVPDDPVPSAVLISGLSSGAMDEVIGAWAPRGLRAGRREAAGRWHAATLHA